MFISINGQRHYLWRAVDQNENVLDILVKSRRDAKAAKKFFKKLLKDPQYRPRVLITNKLGPAGVAHRPLMHRSSTATRSISGNRADNSHQPTQQRKPPMRRLHSSRGAQRFLSAFSGNSPHFHLPRHRLSATEYRAEIAQHFAV